MAPDDSDDKKPAGAGIASKEGGTVAPADDVTGETPVVRIEETTTVVRWEAPLPPPALLEEFDRVVPGLARQIAEQARASADHIRECEKNAQKKAIESITRGQRMGFFVVLAIMGVSVFAIEKGAWWVAGIALSIVTGTAARFVLGTLGKSDKKRQGE